MRETPEELQRRMARLRSEMGQDVESVFDTAEELTDWKHYVRRYPWIAVTAAAAVGYLVVPARRTAGDADLDAFLKRAQRYGLVVERDSTERGAQGGWMRTVMGVAGPIVTRALVTYAGRKLGDYLDGVQDGKHKVGAEGHFDD
jgi:hypothetical protein